MFNINWEKVWFYSTLIFRPSYWLKQGGYCKEWDRKLNQLLEKYDFKNIGKHTADLGDYTIWISNHPYASFDMWLGFEGKLRGFPSRYTVYKAHKKLKKDQYDLS